MKTLLFFLTLIIPELVMSQNFEFENSLYNSYNKYREQSLTHRRFKHSDIKPLIKKLKNDDRFSIKEAGKSVEERELYLIKVGTGKKKIFLWSQMHGDEPTATAALFDIFNFFISADNIKFCNSLFSELTLYFLPMVNPDGAERFKRRNFYDIDLNRDASRLQCPEAVILKEVFDSIKADFGFNLHDQSHRYSVGNTFKTATISFLAPAFNQEKEINSVRKNAVKLIGNLYEALNQFIPGHIARYSDEYEPRAFGDNFQKWGTSTILIESGGWAEDPEKQFIRKLNFIGLLSAFKTIAENGYAETSEEIYNSIPFNDKYIFDLVLRNLTLKYGTANIKIDVGINMDEIESSTKENIYYKSQVADLGDLSVYYGYRDYDFNGYTIEQASVFKDTIYTAKELDKLDYMQLYKKGCVTLIVKNLPDKIYTPIPINLASRNKIDTTINIGESANFVLKKDGKVDYVVINGFLNKIDKNRRPEGNGLIIR